MEIPWAASLRSGARQPLAAEGLHADHGADLVAVDVDVADASTSGDALHRRIDAAVDAEGQAIAGPVDRVHDTVDAVAVEARDVEDRPEALPLPLGDGIDLEGPRRQEGAALTPAAPRPPAHQPAVATWARTERGR